MAVLSRAREQQAIEAGERQMPPEEPDMSIRQRTNYNRSGINAKRVMYNIKKDSEVEAPRGVSLHKTNFKNPTDFFAGPTEPGRITGGPRRFDGVNTDCVGYMLSEEFQNQEMPKGPVKPVGGPQHVDNKCYPVYPEPKYKAMVKPMQEGQGLDAPYFEDNNPKAPREAAKANTVKCFPEKANAPTGITFPPAPAGAPPLHGNRSNESKDLLNLSRYTPAQLNEKDSHRQTGKVKWEAPAMDYPKRRPATQPIHCAATRCHDVLGTERFGRRDEPEPQGIKMVDDYPYKDQSNLIAHVEQPKQEPRPVKTNTMLRYYDPAIDDISKFAGNEKPVGKAHPRDKPMNYTSNSDFVQSGGKARGAYNCRNQSSIVFA